MLEKITESQLLEKGVISAPDQLVGDPEENKRVFDRLVAELVAPAYNACVEAVNELVSTEQGIVAAEEGRITAEELRETAEEGRDEAERSRTEAEEARDAAEQTRTEAEAAREHKETGYVAQAEDAAKLSQSWAEGGTGLRSDEETNNAKYWAGQAKNAAKGDMKAEVYDPNGVAAPMAFRPQYVEATMLASGWVDGKYSFEATYPKATYDISIEVAHTATSDQFEAFGAAMICGSVDSNIATALGDVPTVDIPIIIKAVAK